MIIALSMVQDSLVAEKVGDEKFWRIAVVICGSLGIGANAAQRFVESERIVCQVPYDPRPPQPWGLFAFFWDAEINLPDPALFEH